MGPVRLIWDATENKEVNGTVICQNSSMSFFFTFFEKKLQHVGHQRIAQWVNECDPPGSIGGIVS